MLRCWMALGEWSAVGEQVNRLWASELDVLDAGVSLQPLSASHMPETAASAASASLRAQVAALAGKAAWHAQQWGALERFVHALDPESLDGAFLRAVHALHRGDVQGAHTSVAAARHRLQLGLAALVGESYERAYSLAVSAQELAEMEELLELQNITARLASRAPDSRGAPPHEEEEETAHDDDEARELLERRAVLLGALSLPPFVLLSYSLVSFSAPCPPLPSHQLLVC